MPGHLLITVVVSVYLLVDGFRFGNWLIGSSPLSQRGWVSSVPEILQRVVGGYIRGRVQSDLYGGDAVCRHEHPWVRSAPLIATLAFFLEFIPDIGTIITGFVAVVIALTVSWQLALITLIYTLLSTARGICALASHYWQSRGDQAGGIIAGNDSRVPSCLASGVRS